MVVGPFLRPVIQIQSSLIPLYFKNKLRMDMENQLLFCDPLFFLENDVVILQKAEEDFGCNGSIWDQQLNENIQQEFDRIDIVCQEIGEKICIKDTPISEVIDFADQRFTLSNQQKTELLKKIKKIKMAEKRAEAKKRRELKTKAHSFCYQTPKLSTIQTSTEETKRKRNRLSAQTSRDRKKQYMNSLQASNDHLLRQKQLLEEENKKLKALQQNTLKEQNKQFPSENKGFLSLLVFLGIIFLIQILSGRNIKKKQSKCQKSVVGKKKLLDENDKQLIKRELENLNISKYFQCLDLEAISYIPASLKSSLVSIKEQFMY